MSNLTLHIVTENGKYHKYPITEGHIESTIHSFRDGGLYDLTEGYETIGDGSAWITRGRKTLSTEELDKIRDGYKG